ncbi:MAG: hypothetical protein ISR58_05390 [Anaerolineales bacterium]|nr:hypothetical protein [Chloroflexota bacterium]MBL6980608.1 hypothetical protein [Anaerolineales bacterium]
MTSSIKPTWEHANSRFISATLGQIDTLQTCYLSGQSLNSVIPDISLPKAEVIVAESLEADLIWNLPPAELLSGFFAEKPVSDFKRVALFEIIYTVHQIALEQKEKDKARDWWALAMATLAIQRGLDLIEQRGDDEQLQDQLKKGLDAMANSQLKGRESTLAATILESLQNSLVLDFDIMHSHSIDDLCHELVPDLSDVPVKRPMSPGDFPLPDRDEILAAFQRFQISSPRKKAKRGRRGRKKKSS